MKTADNDAGLVILPDLSEILHCHLHHGLTRRMRTMADIIARISRMVSDEMRKARRLSVAPPINLDTRVYPAVIAVMPVIYAATIMLKPVADNQIIHFQHHVVTGNLVENLWVISYFGRLVFNWAVRSFR